MHGKYVMTARSNPAGEEEVTFALNEYIMKII